MANGFFAAAMLVGTSLTPPSSAESATPPTLLILGSPHLANHFRDVVNIRVTDVTTAQRQREIEAMVDRLAAFRPTHVAVEWASTGQEQLDQRYADYRAGRYKLSADEVDQIGLRLAARLKLKRVDAVNWNESAPGDASEYDFIAYANTHGLAAGWDAQTRKAQAEADAEGRLMTCTPVSSWYRKFNAPGWRRDSFKPYFAIAKLGDAVHNPGAAWVGAWYARNLRILKNLVAIAPASSDRVILVIGAGHGFLLDQQASQSGAFRVADTLAFLQTSRSKQASCKAGTSLYQLDGASNVK